MGMDQELWAGSKVLRGWSKALYGSEPLQARRRCPRGPATCTPGDEAGIAENGGFWEQLENILPSWSNTSLRNESLPPYRSLMRRPWRMTAVQTALPNPYPPPPPQPLESQLLLGFWVLVKFQAMNTQLTDAFDSTASIPMHAHSCKLKQNIVKAWIWTRLKI